MGKVLQEPGLEEVSSVGNDGECFRGRPLQKDTGQVKGAARLHRVWKQLRSERSLGATCLWALEGFDFYSKCDVVHLERFKQKSDL